MGMKRAAALVFALAFIWPAAAEPSRLDRELEALVTLYEGAYKSKPEEGAREGTATLFRVVRVTPPEGRRFALYAEMRKDNENGEVTRQRLYVFDESPDRVTNRMTALSFADPKAAEELIAHPERAAGLATTDALGAGCATVWTADGMGFAGKIDPNLCIITGKRGDTRKIEAITLLRHADIELLERGYDLDGKLLFGNPDGKLYVWPRLNQN